MICGTVMSAASRSQSQCFASRNVITAEILNGGVCVQHEILGRSRQRSRKLNSSSPAFILPKRQLRRLT